MHFYVNFLLLEKNGGMYKVDGALTQRANCCDNYSNNQRWSRLPIGCWAM